MNADNDLANFETGELDTAANDGGDLAKAGGFAGEIAGETGGGRKVDTSLIVLASVFVAGAAGIWSMRAFGLAFGATTGGTSKAEAAVLDYIQRSDSDNDISKADLDLGIDDQKWVPASNLRTNPFVIPDVDIVTDLPPVDPVQEDVKPDLDEIKRMAAEELMQAGRGLELSSIIDGARPVAFLEGGARTIDDEFEIDGVEWTIESIENDSVTLTTFCMVGRRTIRVTRSTNEDIDNAR